MREIGGFFKMQDYLYKVFLNQWLQNEGKKNKKAMPRMVYKYQDLNLRTVSKIVFKVSKKW